MTEHDPAPLSKRAALEMLGGTVTEAARIVGCSHQAVSNWPDILTPRLRDRVQAARWRLDQAERMEEKRAWAYAQEAGRPASLESASSKA